MDEDLKRQMVEELNALLASREPEIEQMYPRIREAYLNQYEWPEIDTLRHEVSICLIFGLHQAAITLTNHMLESLLKFSLSYKAAYVKGHRPEDLVSVLKPSFERYDDKDLSYTINQSCSVGLINKEQKKQLHQFRESFRNAYGHAEKKKIHQDKSVPVQFMQLNGDANITARPEELLKILDLPFIHGLAQYEHAKANAAPYFLYVDALVRELMPKVFPGLSSQGTDTPSQG